MIEGVQCLIGGPQLDFNFNLKAQLKPPRAKLLIIARETVEKELF